MLPVVLLAALASSPAATLVERSEAARRAGRLDECLKVLEAGAPAGASSVDQLRVRLQRARCSYYRSSLAGTPQDANVAGLRRIVEESAAAGDARLLADARDQLGIALYGRDFRANGQEEARGFFEQALAARRASGDARAVAESLFHVGLTWENKKDPTPDDNRRARELHEESLRTAEAGGFDVEASYAVRHLAGHKEDAGDLDGALAGFERSLALRQKAGYAIYYAPSLLAIGDVWKAKGDAAKARDYFRRARVEADRIGAARFQKMADDALASLDRPAVR